MRIRRRPGTAPAATGLLPGWRSLHPRVAGPAAAAVALAVAGAMLVIGLG